jgi:hypothetical protein
MAPLFPLDKERRMIRVLGFKQDFRPDGRVYDMVHFTSSDAMTDTGEPTHSTWERISRLTPPEFMENDDGGLKMAALRSQWNQIEPSYAAWKQGQEIPESGTPLGAWPAIDAARAEALRAAGMRTVEDVARVGENVLARPPLPNLRALKDQAKAFLENRDLSARDAQISDLQAQNAAMLEMLAELQADKPKRGRPPKAQADEPEEEAAA